MISGPRVRRRRLGHLVLVAVIVLATLAGLAIAALCVLILLPID